MTAALKNEGYKAWTRSYAWVMGPIKSTQFETNGKLTPEEFVAAGDALVRSCPTWKWAGSDSKIQPHLPQDKKYLVMCGAQCAERANALGAEQGGERDEDGWLVTHKDHVESGEVPTMGGGEHSPTAAEGEAMDMDMDMDVGLEDDPVVTAPEDTLPCRTYDIHILYDDYHGTPRVYMMGYAENQGGALSREAMFEDIYSEYADKTATMERHPYIEVHMASIHPCRHAETMKRMIDTIKEQHSSELDGKGEGFGMRPEMALFLFLKFINSVIPTIDFDFTMDVRMGL